MNVEVPRTVAISAVRCDLPNAREPAVLECVTRQRPRVFRLSPLRIIAARDDQDGFVQWGRPDLMEIDSLLQIGRLLHLIADTAVALDLVDRDAGRKIVSDQHMFAGVIHTRMDGPLL